MLVIVGLTFIMLMETDRSRDGGGGASETNEPSFGDFRVRSVIILQDKPHDRERLLLKFLKIMKVVRVRSRNVLLSLHLYSKLVSVLALQQLHQSRLTNCNKQIFTNSLHHYKICVHVWSVVTSSCQTAHVLCPAAPEEAQ